MSGCVRIECPLPHSKKHVRNKVVVVGIVRCLVSKRDRPRSVQLVLMRGTVDPLENTVIEVVKMVAFLPPSLRELRSELLITKHLPVY